MKFELTILQNRALLIIFSSAILINIAAWVLVLFFLNKERLNIILHYNVLFGVDFKGNPEQVFIIPLISSVIFILNAIIAKFIRKKDEFIAYLLFSASLTCQIFAVIAIVAIILINNNGSY